MKKRRICVVITARPSYARIKSVLSAIKKHSNLELQLVLTASALLERYGSVVDVIRKDGFQENAIVYMLVEGENLVTSAKSTGMGIIELTTVFDKFKPHVVLSVADRYETIATAIAGSYLNIPVVHVQGGEVSGSIDEKVRHAVTKLADLHMVANQQAAYRVLQMGERPESVFVTGCPSIDLAASVLKGPSRLTPQDLRQGVGAKLGTKSPYLIVMQHPVTYEWQLARERMSQLLSLIKKLSLPTFWFWPNVDAGSDASSKAIREFREENKNTRIRFLRNFSPEKFLELLNGSICLVGNSSVGIRESAFLGVPVVNIGSRQAGRDRGPNVIDVPEDSHEILEAIKQQMNRQHYESSLLYGDGQAGKRIADLLATVSLSTEKKISFSHLNREIVVPNPLEI